ncbi:MAG TPA: hypothetical protein VMX97_06005 [Hyphomicrobiaceae bacterium]|nr:hypothetical protein [Hyphomicrobiaceae bacterium]
MPESEADLLQFRRRQNSVGVDDSQKLVANMPPYPEKLKRVIPEMKEHETQLKEWIKELIIAIRGGVG